MLAVPGADAGRGKHQLGDHGRHQVVALLVRGDHLAVSERNRRLGTWVGVGVDGVELGLSWGGEVVDGVVKLGWSSCLGVEVGIGVQVGLEIWLLAVDRPLCKNVFNLWLQYRNPTNGFSPKASKSKDPLPNPHRSAV